MSKDLYMSVSRSFMNYYPKLAQHKSSSAGKEMNYLWSNPPQIKILINNENSKFFFSFFLFPYATGSHLWHMEVPGPEVELELQIPAYTNSQDNNRSESHLWPIPQLVMMPDSYPTERGQGSNPDPHRHYVRFLTCWATRELWKQKNIYLCNNKSTFQKHCAK